MLFIILPFELIPLFNPYPITNVLSLWINHLITIIYYY